MALYSAEIVFRDGTRRELTYDYARFHVCCIGQVLREVPTRPGKTRWGCGTESLKDAKYLTLSSNDGRYSAFNLDAVASLETSPVAADKT